MPDRAVYCVGHQKESVTTQQSGSATTHDGDGRRQASCYPSVVDSLSGKPVIALARLRIPWPASDAAPACSSQYLNDRGTTNGNNCFLSPPFHLESLTERKPHPESITGEMSSSRDTRPSYQGGQLPPVSSLLASGSNILPPTSSPHIMSNTNEYPHGRWHYPHAGSSGALERPPTNMFAEMSLPYFPPPPQSNQVDTRMDYGHPRTPQSAAGGSPQTPTTYLDHQHVPRYGGEAVSPGSHRSTPRSTTGTEFGYGSRPGSFDHSVGHEDHKTPTYGEVSTPGDDSVVDCSSELSTLPKFVREEQVAGKGLCYFYDDGSHCQAIIDGEQVNKHWGVTKAGKPRKRLAMACIICREKKIKCEQGVPKCVQCDKYNRDCRIKFTHRGHHSSPSISYEGRESRSVQASPESPFPLTNERSHHKLPTRSLSHEDGHEHAVAPKRRSTPSLDDHNPMSAGQDGLDGSSSKRRRRSSPSSRFAPRFDAESNHPSTMGLRGPLVDRSVDRAAESRNTSLPLGFQFRWDQDPYRVDPELVLELMDLYFQHINNGAYALLPHGPFIEWLKSDGKKSQADLALVFSMLATASRFHAGLSKSVARDFAAISRDAVDRLHGDFSLQLAQCRLIVTLYYFAVGNHSEAWDYCGSAFRVAIALKLNLEVDVASVSDDDVPFGLTRIGYLECRRRTFWSCYLMDMEQKFSGFCSGHIATFNDRDIFLRMPMDDADYSNQDGVDIPYFEANKMVPDSVETSAKLGPRAHLIQVASIWNEVLAYLYRSVHEDKGTYPQEYERFNSKARQWLEAWHENLPLNLKYAIHDGDNLDASTRGKYGPVFVAMHALYHTTIMKLNRHARSKYLRHTYVAGLVKHADDHAAFFLRMMHDLVTQRDRMPDMTRGSDLPIVGYAILTACDMISGKGRVSDISSLLKMMEGGLLVLCRLAKYWASAKDQLSRVEKRVRDLSDLLTGPPIAPGTKPAGVIVQDKDRFSMNAPMESGFSRDDDLIHALTLQEYLSAKEGVERANVPDNRS